MQHHVFYKKVERFNLPGSRIIPQKAYDFHVVHFCHRHSLKNRLWRFRRRRVDVAYIARRRFRTRRVLLRNQDSRQIYWQCRRKARIYGSRSRYLRKPNEDDEWLILLNHPDQTEYRPVRILKGLPEGALSFYPTISSKLEPKHHTTNTTTTNTTTKHVPVV